MIQVTPQMRILVAVEPADFRKGIDGLARVCTQSLLEDPFAVVVFVFRNRASTAVKILVYDGRGFWLLQRRLSSGRFRWWPQDLTRPATSLEAHELMVLVQGGDPESARGAPAWRPVNVASS